MPATYYQSFVIIRFRTQPNIVLEFWIIYGIRLGQMNAEVDDEERRRKKNGRETTLVGSLLKYHVRVDGERIVSLILW